MEELLNLIIGNEPFYKQIGFIFFALLGMFLIKLIRFNAKKKRELKQTPPVYLKFNFSHWLNDNLLDFVCALISSFLVYRFLHDTLLTVNSYFVVVPKFIDTMFYGLLLGFCFQYILHKIMNKFKIVS